MENFKHDKRNHIKLDYENVIREGYSFSVATHTFNITELDKNRDYLKFAIDEAIDDERSMVSFMNTDLLLKDAEQLLTNISVFIDFQKKKLEEYYEIINGAISHAVLDSVSWANTVPSMKEVGTSKEFIPLNMKGENNGVAELNDDGKVPVSQLPAFVDNVQSYPTKSNFPTTGLGAVIYISKDDNKTWRWTGSDYVEVSQSIALGETSSTAYRGDRGKIAYDHSVNSYNKGEVDSLLLTKSEITHKHDTSDVISGSFHLDRIPTIPHTKTNFANQTLNDNSTPSFNGMNLQPTSTSTQHYLRFNIGSGTDTNEPYRIYQWGSSRDFCVEGMGNVNVVLDYNNNATDKEFAVRHNAEANDGTKLFSVNENGNISFHGGTLVNGIVPIDRVTGLQGLLDDKSNTSHLHDTRYSRKTGLFVKDIPSTGWYTIATVATGRAFGEFLVSDVTTGRHNFVKITAGSSYGQNTLLAQAGLKYATQTIANVRILYNTADRVYGGAKLQVYCTNQQFRLQVYGENIWDVNGWTGWTVVTPYLDAESGWAVDKQLNDITDRNYQFWGNLKGKSYDSDRLGGLAAASYSLVGHNHIIADVTGLQTALNNKQNVLSGNSITSHYHDSRYLQLTGGALSNNLSITDLATFNTANGIGPGVDTLFTFSKLNSNQVIYMNSGIASDGLVFRAFLNGDNYRNILELKPSDNSVNVPNGNLNVTEGIVDVYNNTGTGGVPMLKLTSKHTTSNLQHLYSVSIAPREWSYTIDDVSTGTDLTISTKENGGTFTTGAGKIILNPHGPSVDITKDLRLVNGSDIVRLSTNGTYSANPDLTITNKFGNLSIGPKNTSWCHVYTDRPGFYFNKDISILGNTVSVEGHNHNIADVNGLQGLLDDNSETVKNEVGLDYKVYNSGKGSNDFGTGTSTGYMLLCEYKVATNINGTLFSERTTGYRNIEKIEIGYSNGSSSLLSNTFLKVIHSDEQADNAHFDLVIVTYNSKSYVAIRKMHGRYTWTKSRFVGHINNTDNNCMTWYASTGITVTEVLVGHNSPSETTREYLYHDLVDKYGRVMSNGVENTTFVAQLSGVAGTVAERSITIKATRQVCGTETFVDLTIPKTGNFTSNDDGFFIEGFPTKFRLGASGSPLRVGNALIVHGQGSITDALVYAYTTGSGSGIMFTPANGDFIWPSVTGINAIVQNFTIRYKI